MKSKPDIEQEKEQFIIKWCSDRALDAKDEVNRSNALDAWNVKVLFF
jgi:hypothetical protein